MQIVNKKEEAEKGRKGFDLLVELFQGVIEETRLMTPMKAEKVVQTWCENHGYRDYEDYKKAVDEGMPDNELLWYSGIELEHDSYGLEMCVECGRSLRRGSGSFVNRIPVFDDPETRKENGHPFPEGEYVCADCDSARDRLPTET